MKRFWVTLAGAWIVLSLGVYALFHWCAEPNADAWVAIYFNQARVPMFTGFLTLGSFLLTLQTAIIQRLKEAYDSTDTAENFLAAYEQEQNPKKKSGLRYYESLENISTALSANVILALTASACQLTLGFIQTVPSTVVCIGIAATALGLVIYLTREMLAAHRAWFEKMERQKRKELGLEVASASEKTT